MFDGLKNLITWLKIGKALSETAESIKKETTNMNAKSIITSKTFWFNIISGGIGIAGIIMNSPLASDPKVQLGGTLFVSIGNLILRAITNQPVTLPGQGA